MTLSNCLSKIDPKTTDIRFYEALEFCEPTIHTTTMNVDELYKDWYGKCNICPENGDFIYAIEFSTYDGKYYMVDNTDCMGFTFEELMREIEKTFYKENK